MRCDGPQGRSARRERGGITRFRRAAQLLRYEPHDKRCPHDAKPRCVSDLQHDGASATANAMSAAGGQHHLGDDKRIERPLHGYFTSNA
jgi:hypothetical protein